MDANGYFDQLPCSQTQPAPPFNPGTWPTPPTPLCGEPAYVDLPALGFLGDPDVRLTPTHGVFGSRADTLDGAGPLLSLGGGFVFVDAVAPAGWSEDDTLLWGPLPSTSSSGNVYVVLSEGEWPGLPGGYSPGTVLDSSGIAMTTAWPTGSAFRFADIVQDNQPDATEPVIAVSGPAPTLATLLSVRMVPGQAQDPAGTQILGNDPELALVLHSDGFGLKITDSGVADALYTISPCAIGGVGGGGIPAPSALPLLAAVFALAIVLRRRR
jgi:hypothetical protein